MSDRVSFICYSRAAPQGSKRHLGGGVLIVEQQARQALPL